MRAHQRYFELTGFNAPAAGGPSTKGLTGERKECDYDAGMIISEELGYGREEVTAVYLVRCCSGQQIPDTSLSRFSELTGDSPSFA